MESAGPEQLSAADASHIEIDAADQVNSFLLAGILGVGGFVSRAAVDLDALRHHLLRRLGDPARPGLARFTQRVDVAHLPLTWESCEPDLRWHVRLSDPVEGEEGLAALAAALMTVPMPLDRPLWELLVVPGARADGVGLILRLHHAVADGVHGVRLVTELLGARARPPSPPAAAPAADVVADAAADAASTSASARQVAHDRRESWGRSGRESWRRSRRESWRRMATSAVRMTAVLRATEPHTVLLGRISPRRGVALVDVDLEALARAARSEGATVNDALLSAVGVAVAEALRSSGQPVPPALPASVPVALPGGGTSGNAVGVMVVPLPTDEPDPDRRLARIAAATRSQKEAARVQGTFELTRSRWGSKVFAWLARRQRFVALFVTNVRGPREQLDVAGAPLLKAWPVAPLQGNVRCGVAAMSYAGRLGVALHCDADALRVQEAGRALAAELERIAEARPTQR